MATFERTEDIDAWKKARALTRQIYQATRQPTTAKDFRLVGQVTAASTSIMSNVAEGFERGGNKEFIQFLWVAKGSAGEVRSLLYVMLDQQYLSTQQFDMLLNLTLEISRMLTGLINYLKNSDFKGRKYADR